MLTAAAISSINKKRKTVVVNMGTADGAAKRSRVCFYSGSGSQVTCGVVVRARKSTATVRVTKKFNMLTVGMEARSAGGKGRAVAAGSSHNTNLKAAYIFTPMPPATFNRLAYSFDQAEGSAWSVVEDSGMSFLAVGGEFEYGISRDMSIAVGGRFRMYDGFQSQADYSAEDKAQYIENNQSAQAFGGWADFYFLNMNMGPGDLKLGGGLDLDMSSHEFKATWYNDTSGEQRDFVAVTTSAMTISLRAPMHYDIYVNPVGFTFGANLLIPVTSSVSSSVGTPFEEADPDALMEDLLASINHNKASFGLELVLSAYFAF
jgi:hypothetical protein